MSFLLGFMEDVQRDKWVYMTTLYLVITNPHLNVAASYNASEQTTSAFLKNVTPWVIYHQKPEVS